MATQWNTLYKEFLNNKVRDVNLATKYTEYELQTLLDGWLKDARNVFRDLAIDEEGATIKKMEDVTNPTINTYEYQFNGTSDTRELIPNPSVDSSFGVYVNEEVWTDYTYNENTFEMTIDNTPNQLNDVYIEVKSSGQFNQTLNLYEERIVLDLMQLVFIDEQLINEKLLNQRVYGKDYGMHSQANHIGALDRLSDRRYIRVVQRMNLYTYRQDPDELSGLSGEV